MMEKRSSVSKGYAFVLNNTFSRIRYISNGYVRQNSTHPERGASGILAVWFDNDEGIRFATGQMSVAGGGDVYLFRVGLFGGRGCTYYRQSTFSRPSPLMQVTVSYRCEKDKIERQVFTNKASTVFFAAVMMAFERGQVSVSASARHMLEGLLKKERGTLSPDIVHHD